jgi:hypothetical protein
MGDYPSGITAIPRIIQALAAALVGNGADGLELASMESVDIDHSSFQNGHGPVMAGLR